MVLSVDLGSTNIKAALFDPAGNRIGKASRPLPYTRHSNACAELEPEEVAATFFGVLDDALESVGAKREVLRTVGISSQAQTFCVCDEAGNAVGPFLGWTDARADLEAEELRAVLGDRFHATTGMPGVSPELLLSKALWSKRNAKLGKPHRIVHLPSYLAMRLGAPQGTDRNLAAMSGLYSIPRGGWWPEAIEAACLESEQLGGLVETGQKVPTLEGCRPHGFSSGLNIVFAGNDHTAGAVGCGSGRPVLTLGTAGVLYRMAPEGPGPFPSGGIWGPFPGDSFYELLCLSHACSALDWADKHLFGKVDTPRLAREAESTDGRIDILFDPMRWGTPSAWSGVQEKPAMARAAFEGIAFALRDLAGGSFPLAQGGVSLLGGGARCDFWAQLLADIFQLPMHRSERDGLDGVAILAGCTPRQTSTPEDVFLPRPEMAPLLEDKFRRWQERFHAP